AAAAPAVAPDVDDQLVETWIAERVVLHLADGPEACHAEADGGAEDARLGKRRVDAAVGPEPVPEPRRRAEHTAGPPDVLAHHDHVAVPCQLDVETVVDRLHDAELSQRGLRGRGGARPGHSRTSMADRRTRSRRAAPDP